MDKTTKWHAAGLLLLATMAWGGLFPVAVRALAVIDPFHLTAIRYGITATLFVGLLLIVEGPRALRTEGRAGRVAALGSIGFAGFGLLGFVGLTHSRPEHGAIIMATQPLVAAVVAWWVRGAQPSRATLGWLGVALAGVVLVVTKGHAHGLFDGGTGWGDLLIFLGAVCWVVYSLGAAEFTSWSPLRYTALTCALGLPAVLVATTLASATGHADAPSLAEVASVRWPLAYIILVSSFVAVLCWNAGMRDVGPVDGMLFINFVPVTAFAIRIAQGHRFAPIEFVGAALVIAALVANNVVARRAAAGAMSPVRAPALRPALTRSPAGP
jgi:drug/metabolite transporter (DMT)-like permease